MFLFQRDTHWLSLKHYPLWVLAPLLISTPANAWNTSGHVWHEVNSPSCTPGYTLTRFNITLCECFRYWWQWRSFQALSSIITCLQKLWDFYGYWRSVIHFEVYDGCHSLKLSNHTLMIGEMVIRENSRHVSQVVHRVREKRGHVAGGATPSRAFVYLIPWSDNLSSTPKSGYVCCCVWSAKTWHCNGTPCNLSAKDMQKVVWWVASTVNVATGGTVSNHLVICVQRAHVYN